MSKRDDYFRCTMCKGLFKDEDCSIKYDSEGASDGYRCPNLCEPSYTQPPYESPIDDE